MRPLGPAVRAGRRADGRDGQVIPKFWNKVVGVWGRWWGDAARGGGGGEGDVVRGRAPLLLIGNSREGAAPRGACLAGSSAVSGPYGAEAGIPKFWNSAVRARRGA